MINLKIEKKDLWLLAAIVVFLIGVGFVIAYGSGNPQVHGHDVGEVEGAGTIFGSGSSMNLSGTGNYEVLCFATYFTCEDYATTLNLDGVGVKTYSAAGSDTAGCDQNAIMVKKTISAGSHNWSLSRGIQQDFSWIAKKV